MAPISLPEEMKKSETQISQQLPKRCSFEFTLYLKAVLCALYIVTEVIFKVGIDSLFSEKMKVKLRLI